MTSTLVLHAYDARNRGDGLLVSESIRLLSRAGLDATEFRVVAVNAASFGGELSAVQYPLFGTRGLRRIRDSFTVALLAIGGVTTGRISRPVQLARLAREADVIVGVGGGYLQAGDRHAATQAGLVHVPQLAIAASSRAPTIYLPQSIGPLSGPVGGAIRRHLAKITLVASRDDETVAELAGPNVLRFPDLAVLRIGRELGTDPPRSGGTRVIGIARELGLPGYDKHLITLQQRLPIEWAVHSRAVGQDDAAFYRRIGVEESGGSADLLDDHGFGVLVSVRLHGALQGILAGVPAIHLSYERKGSGAYSDLGLDEWMHDARTFDPDLVAHQAEELRQDPTRYWHALDRAIPRLRASEEKLIAQVRRAAQGHAPDAHD